MILVFALSSVAMIGGLFSNDDAANTVIRKPNLENGDIIVVPGEDSPEDPVEPEEPAIPDIQLPAEATSTLAYEEVEFHNKSNDSNNYLTIDDNYVVYNGPADYDFTTEDNSYVSIALIDPCERSEIYYNGIDLSKYSYIHIGFTVNNDKYTPEESSILGCSIYPVCRYDTSSYAVNTDYFLRVVSSMNEENFDIESSGGIQSGTTSQTVDYVFEINKEDTSMSRLQVFLNGICVFDNYGEELYKVDPVYLSEIRLWKFNSKSSESSIGFSNLEISVYE